MQLGKLCILAGSSALLIAFFCSLPSCGKQGEGERCDQANGDEDCEDGLVCTSKQDLQTSSDICCPPAGVEPTDLACIPGSLADAGVGGSSTGGAGGAGGTGGSSTGGAGGAGGTGGSSTGGAGGAGGTGGTGGSSTGGAGGAGGAGTAGAGG